MAPQSGRPSSRSKNGAADMGAGSGAGAESLIRDSRARPSVGRSASRQQAGMLASVTGIRVRSASPAARSAQAECTARETPVSSTTMMRGELASSGAGRGGTGLESMGAVSFDLAGVRASIARIDLSRTHWHDRAHMLARARCIGATVALALCVCPVFAAAEILLAPGFAIRVYVTGEGFETPTGTSGRGIPSTSTLVVDDKGVLYLGRTGRRYSSGEYEYLTPLYRIPAGGARFTPSTESRYFYGPPLINAQLGSVRGGRGPLPPHSHAPAVEGAALPLHHR